MAVMMPVMTLVMNGVSLLIVWFGGKQIAESNLQVGDMMAFIQYAMHVIMSFLFISMMFIMVPRASVSAERIYEVLSTENRVKNPEQPQHVKEAKGRGAFRPTSASAMTAQMPKCSATSALRRARAKQPLLSVRRVPANRRWST